jgi:hypothetical protein
MTNPISYNDCHRSVLIPLLSKPILIVVTLLILGSPSIWAWDKINPNQAPAQDMFPQWDAVILKDQAVMEIQANGEALLTQHRIMKIFSDPDKRYCHQEVPFNSNIDVLSISARTIHPNGDEFFLEKEDIREKSLIFEFSLYSDVKAKEFYLPRVTKDCLVEYEYQFRLKSLLYWSDWYFRSDLPSLYSGYTLIFPKDFNSRAKVLKAYIEPKIDFKKGKQVFLWESWNNAAVRKEVFMPSAVDSIPRLAFSPVQFNFDGRVFASRTWNDIAAWYLEISRPSIVPTDQISSLAADLTSGLSSDQAKIKAIFDYVQEHIRYVSIAVGVGAYRPHLCSEILEYGYGDCKDMTSLMIALLKGVEIESYPALLSTRRHQSVLESIPSIKPFDHVVVAVPRDDGYIWLDPACRNCRFGELPFEDQGASALIVRPDWGELTLIPETGEDENTTYTTWDITLGSDGSVTGSLHIQATGQEELAFKASLTELRPQRRIKALVNFLNSWFVNPYLISSEFLNFENGDSNISVQAGFLSDGFGVIDKGNLFIPVNLNTQDYLGVMFPDLQRNHPILFDYRFINEDIMKVRIPPEFEITHLPGAVKLDQPFGLFQSTYSVNQDTLIHKRLFIRRELLIPVDGYDRLKEFYDRAAQEDSRQIMLKRKTSNN